MVFLHPVANGIHHVFPEHRPVRGGLVPASGAVGPVSRAGEAVIVIGHDFVQAGVPLIGVVIDHVHHHAQTAFMKRLNHLLEFPDPDPSVPRVRGIAAFRHVVVLRVVSPVELGFLRGLVHRRVIIDGLQVHVGDPQVRQVVDPGRFPRSVGQAVLRESQVFAWVPGGGQFVGEIADVHLPDNRFAVRADAVGPGVLSEPFRIGFPQVHDHAPVSVHPHRPRVGIHRFLDAGRSRHQIGIIRHGGTGGFRCPDAFFTAGHIDGFHRFSAVTRFIQQHLYPAGGRRPDFETRTAVRQRRSQVVSVIEIPFLEGI